MNSLRTEGYRDYGHDIDNLDGVHDVGLSFTCDLSKEFNGKAQVLEAAPQPRSRRLVSAGNPAPGFERWHFVGDLRSVTYGHTLQGVVATDTIHRRVQAMVRRGFYGRRGGGADFSCL